MRGRAQGAHQAGAGGGDGGEVLRGAQHSVPDGGGGGEGEAVQDRHQHRLQRRGEGGVQAGGEGGLSDCHRAGATPPVPGRAQRTVPGGRRDPSLNVL